MSPGAHDRILIQGRVHVTLKAAADCFEVELDWVEQVFTLGLLGAGERLEGGVLIPAEALDRLAVVLRLWRYHGVALGQVGPFLSTRGLP